MAKKHWLVVGGGFRGIMAAHGLLQRGFAVTLVEVAPVLGGVLHSLEWDTFVIDKGCHLFDNATDELTQALFQLTPEAVFSPVKVSYASVIKPDHIAPGVAIADFSGFDLDFREHALWQLLAAAAEEAGAEKPTPAHLADAMHARFGSRVGGVLQSAFRKVYQVSADQISADALDLTVFKRVRLVPDAVGLVLKQVPSLDERLAVSSQDDPLAFYQAGKGYGYRNLYPKSGGLRGWCRLVSEQLAAAGCQLKLGSKVARLDRVKGNGVSVLCEGVGGKHEVVRCDRILWAAGADYLERCLLGTAVLETEVHKVPMVLYYFKVPAGQLTGLTYMHDFCSDTLGYRFSAPGLYSNQYDAQGNSYCCVEVPTEVGSDIWSVPDRFTEQIWSQAKACGLVSAGDYVDSKIVKAPVSYAVPKVGHGRALAALQLAVKRNLPDMVLMRQLSFSKISILQEIQKLLQEI